MNNKILNIFKISLFAFFISSYSFGNEITLNVNQAKNDYRSCYFIVDAFNNTTMNITEIWFNVVYYFKDGYVIDQGNWKWERLRPNKSKLIVDSQSYVRTDEKNMPCNEVGRVEINDLFYVSNSI